MTPKVHKKTIGTRIACARADPWWSRMRARHDAWPAVQRSPRDANQSGEGARQAAHRQRRGCARRACSFNPCSATSHPSTTAPAATRRRSCGRVDVKGRRSSCAPIATTSGREFAR